MDTPLHLPRISNTVGKRISADRFDLELAGLGERTIDFQDYESIDSSAFRKILQTEYPKLADGGGYELMRLPPNSRTLEIIQPPTEGYTPLFLSRVMGTSRTFIRPISRSLNMAKTTDIVTGPSEKCYQCEAYFPMSKLREYLKTCRW
jgi:hypothetical protein